jgi:cysteinyl-tRNA synthetase
MLKITNSLSGKKELFRPIDEGRVRMYVCGITVYDYLHLGHARMLVVFDVVARYLRHAGYELTYVRNITDIDDKIIARAGENSETVDALTARFIEAMNEDCAALGVQPADREPRATQYMDGMIAMIRRLVDKGFAYAADNGDVYYQVAKFDGYGRLSGKRLEDLRAGARIAVDEAKRDPLDFVLWKHAKPGEPSWDSPWGPGRPGWHIECSAMSTAELGTHFDIHGGGMDLKFPHHENEIAQSCAATGDTFVNYWMHNGFVQIDEEKMSKSLGNFFTVREVLKVYSPEVVRTFILGSHYRSPLNYSTENLDTARSSLQRLYLTLRDNPPVGEAPKASPFRERFATVMGDDFNTPEAMAVLFDLAREINRLRDAGRTAEAGAEAALLVELGGVLGLLQENPESMLRGAVSEGRVADAEVDMLIERRNAARKSRDFAEADRIRDELEQQGILLEDGPGGTRWRRG